MLMSAADGKVSLMAMADDNAISHGAHAGNLVKCIAGLVGGGGGGRPNMAQAGGKNPAGIPDALKAAPDCLAGMVK
jgi:alanyl-tRNA synthetase